MPSILPSEPPIWPAIRTEFERVLEYESVAVDRFWQFKLFDETDEDYIRKEVERKLYLPELPNGGPVERGIVERLERVAQMRDFADAWRAAALIEKWQAILPETRETRGRPNPGYYYKRTPMSRRSDAVDFKWFHDRLKEARAASEWDKAWFYELILGGSPEPLADFEMHCLFLLKCADGNVERLVELVNVKGESTGPVRLDAEAFHAPQKYRLWCLERGNFNWAAGEKDLGKLHNDIARLAAWRVINQVVTLGWYPLRKRWVDQRMQCDGIWFTGDGARANTEEGEEWLKPDKDGIYWLDRPDGEREGYLLSDTGAEGKIDVPFYQGKPLLHPGVSITSLELVLPAMPELGFEGWPGEKAESRKQKAEMEAEKTESGKRKAEIETENTDEDVDSAQQTMGEEREKELTRAFFREFCRVLRATVGGDEAYLLVGAFLAYAAGPEIYGTHSLFPGVWVAGQPSSGKSTVCEILMEIFGFTLQGGFMLRGKASTAVGLLQAQGQYSELPIWGDEFRNNEVEPDKMGVLQNGYNRASQPKFNAAGFQRKVRTNFVVSGESTSNDAALRSRFPHIQMSATRRIGEGATVELREQSKLKNFQWLLGHRKFLYVFGRYVIEHRREFVRLVQKWQESWASEQIDSRLRIVHGVGYSAWMAMVEMLGSHGDEERDRFRAHMVEHSQRAAEDVVSDLGVNLFIEDMITAYKAGAVDPKCFVVRTTHMTCAPGTQTQMGWSSAVLILDPESTIAAVESFLVTKLHRTMPLKRKDLRDQMSRCDFWMPDVRSGPGSLSVRFPGQTGNIRGWGIYADKHPMGYQLSSDEDVDAYLANPSLGDPRRGALYQMIDDIKSAQKEN